MSPNEPSADRVRPAATNTGSKDVPWYLKDLDLQKLHEPAQELLREYSGIPSDQILSHVLELVRRKAPVPYPIEQQYGLFSRLTLTPVVCRLASSYCLGRSGVITLTTPWNFYGRRPRRNASTA